MHIQAAWHVHDVAIKIYTSLTRKSSVNISTQIYICANENNIVLFICYIKHSQVKIQAFLGLWELLGT